MKYFICIFILLAGSEISDAQPVKPVPFTCSNSPTIEEYYYNDRGTTGEIEAGVRGVRFAFLNDSTHLVMWAVDIESGGSSVLVLYNWHTGLPVEICPASINFAEKEATQWNNYVAALSKSSNPLQEFRNPEALLAGFTPVPEKSESMYDLTLKLRSGELKPHTIVFARKKTEYEKTAYVEQKYLYLLNYTNRYGEKISSAETRPVTRTEFPLAEAYTDIPICRIGAPVCAVLEQQSVVSFANNFYSGNLRIADVATGNTISRLCNWKEYQSYAARLKQYVADSVYYAEKKQAETDVNSLVLNALPYFQQRISAMVKSLQAEGWKIEKMERMQDFNYDLTVSENIHKWDVNMQPGKVYVNLAFFADERFSPVSNLVINKNEDTYFRDYLLGELWAPGDKPEISGNENGYMYSFSNGAYVTRPQLVSLATWFTGSGNVPDNYTRPDSCGAVLIVSKLKPATSSFTMKTFPGKTFATINLEQAYTLAGNKQKKAKEAELAEEAAARKKEEEEKLAAANAQKQPEEVRATQAARQTNSGNSEAKALAQAAATLISNYITNLNGFLSYQMNLTDALGKCMNRDNWSNGEINSQATSFSYKVVDAWQGSISHLKEAYDILVKLQDIHFAPFCSSWASIESNITDAKMSMGAFIATEKASGMASRLKTYSKAGTGAVMWFEMIKELGAYQQGVLLNSMEEFKNDMKKIVKNAEDC